MSRSDFVELMKKKAGDTKEIKEDKRDAKYSGTRNMNKKIVSVENSRRVLRNDIYPYEEDEEDQKINEEFKGVIRSVKIIFILATKSSCFGKIKTGERKRK